MLALSYLTRKVMAATLGITDEQGHEVQMNGGASLSELKIDQLPNVHKAAISLIRVTGANPVNIFSMKVSNLQPGATIIWGLKPPSRKTAPLGNSHVAHAFREYITLHRPEIVKRLQANGKKVPENLFITDKGKPINVASFQKQLVSALSKRRIPELAGEIKPPATVTRMGPTWNSRKHRAKALNRAS